MNAFIRRLSFGGELTEADRTKLAQLTSAPRTFESGAEIVSQGDSSESWNIVLDGVACRYKTLDDGRRQIVALLLPGDSCDLYGAILGRMDHSIQALSRATVASLPAAVVDELTAGWPRIIRALWWSTLIDEAVLREWLVSMGQRPAEERMAHLLCEVCLRMAAVDCTRGAECDLPLTQSDLADTLGITPVHVNRILQKLRGEQLIQVGRNTLTVLDWDRLKQRGRFDPDYLHLRHLSDWTPAQPVRPAEVQPAR